MERVARRRRDAFGDEPVARRWQVGAAQPYMRGASERRSDIAQPIAMWKGVVVYIADDLAVTRGETGIARAGEPLVRLIDQTNRIISRDGRGIVGGAVIDDDHLVVRVI